MNITTVEYVIVLVFLFLLGSVIGSLLNVCIFRLPREERVWTALKTLFYPPSHCPRCRRRIPFYDNVPILGWLLLRGRCRNCRGRISARYPLVELLTAVLFVSVYWCEIPDWWGGPQAGTLQHVYGPIVAPGASWMSPLAMQHCRYALHMALIVALIVATFIDFDLRIIPDAVTLPAMGVGLAGNFLLGHVYLVPLWYQTQAMRSETFVWRDSIGPLPQWLESSLDFVGIPAWIAAHPHRHGLALSVAGIVVGGGVVWAVRIAGAWGLKREAMGFGDVVLLAMIGSFIGWQGTLVVFVMAPLCALVAVLLALIFRFEREIPFGPYLSLATLILLMGFRWIWPYCERMLSFGPFLPVAGALLFVALCASLWLMRIVLTRLGFGYGESEREVDMEWTAGDQLAHYAGEWTDDRQGQWRRNGRWRGELSSRGSAQAHDWRRGGQ